MNLYNKFKVWNYIRRLNKQYGVNPSIRFLIEKTNRYIIHIYSYNEGTNYFIATAHTRNTNTLKTKEEVNYLFKLLCNKNNVLISFVFCSPKEFDVNPNQVSWSSSEERFNYELSKLLKE